MQTDGTAEANKFIQKYKKNGYLIDFYSNKHVQSLEPETSSISCEDLYKFDSSYGKNYRSHLLTIYLGDENQELIKSLSNLYLPFKRLFNLNSAYGGSLHKPDLLIVNLLTHEILCVGLGRKNNSFHFELHRYLSNRTTNDDTNTMLRDFDASLSTDCSEEFFALDHHCISRKTINAVQELGEHYYEYDNLPGNSDVMVTRKRNGLYYLDDFEDADGMTKAEVNELKQDYKNYEEWIDDCLKLLKEYFPKISVWDLKTGDY